MRSLVCIKPGELEYQDTKDITPLPGHSVIKIKRIGVCGTDLHAFEGTQPYFDYPRILGHELSGELAETNNKTSFSQGEKVTFLPYKNCGKCIACRMGKTNCCTAMQVYGVHIDGGMSDYIQVPDELLVHGNGLAYDELALVEPLSIAAHAVRRAAIKENEFVLVAGAGPIGLGIIEFSRLAGAEVIVADVNAQRLNFCQEKLGIKHTINVMADPVDAKLESITNGDYPTAVFDATGNRKAILKSFEYMAHGARYILVGLQKEDIVFSHPQFHKREACLMSSRNATRDDFDFVIRGITSKKINPLHFISHTISFEAVKDEFNKWLDPSAGVIKAMIHMN